ncbi:glutathione S-transferase [Amniculicola lignicola CBS 123094]|uniref:Glutathione S-transferase n=1 Tax=Amniculicola lignicola CBS 123094 TaxID=1392246 RepID=A0A6A5WGF5_9PLEO|nr:glutathione S-transferase [Amniculicola lignicola CBS 123094]
MAELDASTGAGAKVGVEILAYSTPNCFKISILLEELKLAYGTLYSTRTVDMFKGVQKEAWFTALNPNGKLPVIINHGKAGYVVFESMAIMNYLTQRYDPEDKFSFKDSLEKCTAPSNWFYRMSQPTTHAFPLQRFVGETLRLYGVLNTRLSTRTYIAGPASGTYSIADMAVFPFVDAALVCGIDLQDKFPHMYEWWKRVWERPAVKSGMRVPSGETFRFGYEKMVGMREGDAEGWGEREGRLKGLLEEAQKEFGWVYSSP